MMKTATENKDKKKKLKKKAKVKAFKKKDKVSEKLQIELLQEKYEAIDLDNIKTFADFPLSKKTFKGLKENDYVTPTDIQKETIGLSLRGKDVLGAAKTGSGKTLAFLIPILEILYCKQWTILDGLGALVLTPTRELAYQIYETLRKIGHYHDFSAALIIGGKDLKFEKSRMSQCNIIIGTPGRVLQHMDQNPLFDCVNMQVLVLDEADRCLDMGFQQAMNAIIENLPPQRQTLLFSATQTKSVKDLARLSLTHPSYISVHEHAKYSTPENLTQTYTVCELHEKISVIWSFIRNHHKKKIIIFFSSCKQVKYIYEIFRRLRPGMSLLALYGTLHQLRRMSIYNEFCSKQNAVLFATDLAARGLDFPKVDWVFQADCPEDPETYIHRVGRTARFNRGGQSFLILLPTEEKAMLQLLEQKKIPIEFVEVNPSKLQNPVRKMQAFLARDPELKETAQRAFVAYAKSVHLMSNKQIFNLQALDAEAFAYSLGLAVTPRIRFLERHNKQMKQNNSIKEDKEENTHSLKVDKQVNTYNNKIKFESDDEQSNSNEEESDSKSIDDEPKKSAFDVSESFNNNMKYKPETSAFDVSDDSEKEDLFTVKRKDHDIDDPLSDSEMQIAPLYKSKKPTTKAALVKRILKKKIQPNKKIIFNEEGDVLLNDKEKRSELAQEYENADEGGIDIETAKQVLKAEDKFDKQRFREKIKAKHKEQKRKLKEQKKKELEERDQFGSDSDEPDLSWLPDPDKIYGNKSNDELPESFNPNNELQNYDYNKEEEETKLSKRTEKKSSKRKKNQDSSPIKKSKKQKHIEDINSLSVNEAEELALMLLKNK